MEKNYKKDVLNGSISSAGLQRYMTTPEEKIIAVTDKRISPIEPMLILTQKLPKIC